MSSPFSMDVLHFPACDSRVLHGSPYLFEGPRAAQDPFGSSDQKISFFPPARSSNMILAEPTPEKKKKKLYDQTYIYLFYTIAVGFHWYFGQVLTVVPDTFRNSTPIASICGTKIHIYQHLPTGLVWRVVRP